MLAASETKEGRADERPVPTFLTRWIERYLSAHRPILNRQPDAPTRMLWLSSNDGLTYSAVERVITETTRRAVGIRISPHLFRTAAASTAAIHAGRNPRLASALLHHTDPAVTEQHYNRASSLIAAQTYADLTSHLRNRN